jgi:hypothetical protein
MREWRLSKRTSKFWKRLALFGVPIAVVLIVLGPFSILLVAGVQYAVFPACYGHSTNFTSGAHLGFTIGASQETALQTVLKRHPDAFEDFVALDQPLGNTGYHFPKSADDLRKILSPDQAWVLRRGGSLCLLSRWSTKLKFEDGGLVTITDELGYSGP